MNNEGTANVALSRLTACWAHIRRTQQQYCDIIGHNAPRIVLARLERTAPRVESARKKTPPEIKNVIFLSSERREKDRIDSSRRAHESVVRDTIRYYVAIVSRWNGMVPTNTSLSPYRRLNRQAFFTSLLERRRS